MSRQAILETAADIVAISRWHLFGQKLFQRHAGIVTEIAFFAGVFGAMMKVFGKGLDALPPLMRGIIMTVDRTIYQAALPMYEYFPVTE